MALRGGAAEDADGHSASSSLRERAVRPSDLTETPDTQHQLQKGRRCDLRFWKRKLFSPEDPQYLHKTLGLMCVLSFAYRYRLLFTSVGGSLGFGADAFSWVTMAVHLLLSCSSLIFHVLAKRIVSKPLIIYEEYRLHAIVFSVRCMSVFVYGVARHGLGSAGKQWEPLLTFVLVMAHHVMADLVTWRYGQPDRYTTVRIQDDAEPMNKAVLRFYAFYQFAAVASHLIPSSRVPDMGFNTLIAIQSSAFFMTLNRKSLVTYKTHAVVYTSCLLLSLCAMSHVLTLGEWVATVAAFAVRVKFSTSKYLIWASFAVFLMAKM